jgi:hypothetical protein
LTRERSQNLPYRQFRRGSRLQRWRQIVPAPFAVRSTRMGSRKCDGSACNDDGVTRTRDSKEHRAPDVAIAKQIGRDRCSHHPDDDRPPSRRTKGDQNPRSHSCGGPEHGNTIDRLQQCKAQPRGDKIGHCHSDGQNNACLACERLASRNDHLFCGSAQCPLHSSRPKKIPDVLSLTPSPRRRRCCGSGDYSPHFRSNHHVAVH